MSPTFLHRDDGVHNFPFLIRKCKIMLIKTHKQVHCANNDQLTYTSTPNICGQQN